MVDSQIDGLLFSHLSVMQIATSFAAFVLCMIISGRTAPSAGTHSRASLRYHVDVASRIPVL